MTEPNYVGLATLITAVGGVIMGIIQQFKGVARDKKLDLIHKDTNGSLSALRAELIETKRLLKAQRGKTSTAQRANKPKSK